MNRRCDQCEWWTVWLPSEHSGNCRHDLPQMNLAGRSGTSGYWPEIKDDDWCGKFKAKPTEDHLSSMAEDFAIEGEWSGDPPGEYADGETIAHWTIAMVARDRYEQLTGDKWSEEIASKVRARRIAENTP